MEAGVVEEAETEEATAETEIEANPPNDGERSIKRSDTHRAHRQAVGEVAAEAAEAGVHPQARPMHLTEVIDEAESTESRKKLTKSSWEQKCR